MQDSEEMLHQCKQNETDGDILIKTYDGRWHIWDMFEYGGPTLEISFCPFCGKELDK